MSDLHYALITGASSGIGDCFARALAARGHNLIVVARSLPKLRELAKELTESHAVQVEPVGMDLSEDRAAPRLAKLLRERNLAIDLLVNNAGFGAHGEFCKLSLERQSQMLRLNIQALVELTHLLLPPLLERRSGAIINVSSTASFQPVPYTAVYSATKAFVTSFSLALREEVRPYGVTVVTLCPGATATNFFDAGNYSKRSVLGGLQSPEAVVRAALNALDRGGGLVLPRPIERLMVACERLVPRSLVVKMAGRMFRPPAL